MTEKLLPCPFKHSVKQGSLADDYEPYSTDSLSEDSNWCVCCPVCKSASGFYDTEEEARQAWNTRASSSAGEDTQPLNAGLSEAIKVVDGFINECRAGIKEQTEPAEIAVRIHQRDAACAIANRLSATLAAPTAQRGEDTQVGAALAELREMFPDDDVAIKVSDAEGRIHYWIELNDTDFTNADTLTEAMQKVREWKGAKR